MLMVYSHEQAEANPDVNKSVIEIIVLIFLEYPMINFLKIENILWSILR